MTKRYMLYGKLHSTAAEIISTIYLRRILDSKYYSSVKGKRTFWGKKKKRKKPIYHV